MNDKELIARHPELVALRQFKTNEEIMEALQPGTIFYCTGTSHGEPIEYIEGPLVVSREWLINDLGKRYVFVRHVYGYTDKIYLNDLQHYSLARGVFTTKERARAYYRACRMAYEGDGEWQALVMMRQVEAEEALERIEQAILSQADLHHRKRCP